MECLIVNDMQCVPLKNIDTVYIHTDDKKKMTIYTVGGVTITNNYATEAVCRDAYKKLLKMLYKNRE